MSVVIENTPLAGCVVVQFPVHADERGWFARGFSAPELADAGIDFAPVQTNVALTVRAGTVRGMHLQLAPHGEQKFLRCVRGSVFDVAVDLRAGSASYGQWFGVELTPENGRGLLIPRGFAHGYMATSDDSQVVYAVDALYEAASERGISPLHTRIGIEWPRPISLLSEKDAALDPSAPLEPSGY